MKLMNRKDTIKEVQEEHKLEKGTKTCKAGHELQAKKRFLERFCSKCELKFMNEEVLLQLNPERQ